MNKLLHILIAAGGIVCISGCAQQVSLGGWQSSVERFVTDQANGDVNELRNRVGDGDQPQFAIFSDRSPANSTDVTGVLLGRRAIQGDDWYVFLVGIVKKRDVDDIRVAAFRDEPLGGHPQWIISREDPLAIATYRHANETPWRAPSGGSPAAPKTPTIGFPGEGDLYRLQIAGNAVTVVDEKSGARWTLLIAAPTRRAAIDDLSNPQRGS